MGNQVMTKMLPDPFFGAELNKFSSEIIEDKFLAFFFTQFVFEAGQV
jgi:hypothetical protein